MVVIWMKQKNFAEVGGDRSPSLKLISCPAEQEDWSHACAVGKPRLLSLSCQSSVRTVHLSYFFGFYRNRRDETRQHRPDSASLGRAERKNWMIFVVKLSVFQQSAGESTCARRTSCCVRRSDFGGAAGDYSKINHCSFEPALNHIFQDSFLEREKTSC